LQQAADREIASVVVGGNGHSGALSVWLQRGTCGTQRGTPWAKPAATNRYANFVVSVKIRIYIFTKILAKCVNKYTLLSKNVCACALSMIIYSEYARMKYNEILIIFLERI